MKVSAVVLCAGNSTRFGSDKLQLNIGGEKVWERSVRIFREHPEVDEVIVVGQGSIAGGATRTESAKNGLAAATGDIVLFHDAARPFVTHQLISAVIQATREHSAACPALPVTDTIKQATDKVRTLDRTTLFAVQTPQGGMREDFIRAYSQSTEGFTDDMSALESIGIEPQLVPGDPKNIKITTPTDHIKMTQTEIRSGMGYDIHAFSTDTNRPLYLGGVHFPGEIGLEGHSDADVLIHAVADAILGASGGGDIGILFPNTDPTHKNQPSTDFLKIIRELLDQNGWKIVNIDSSVICEHPKIANRYDEMKKNIGLALGIEPDRINIKATTNEKLGAIGRGEGIAAFATANLSRAR